MSRLTRKQMVGKIENVEEIQRLKELVVLTRLVHREWWAERLGQVAAGAVLPLCPHVQREREQARQEFMTLDPFEHKEE